MACCVNAETSFFPNTHAVPEPTVSIATSSDSAIAGDPFVLTCLVTNLPNNLISDPVLSWSGAGVDQSSVQLLSEGLNLSLSFSPLQTSQGGVYTCTTTLSIPEAGISITETSMTTITVLSKSTLHHQCNKRK